jgi:4-amino-4-deoxy-L-arabinose transferase-like glycosyltransferase
MVSRPDASLILPSDSSPANKSLFHRMTEAQAVLLVAGLAALVFLPFLGSAHMFDPTDSFFMESAREMLETNRLSVPLMNYELWLDKPALHFWLIILSFKMFGLNEFAGRLPSAICGILEVVATYILSRQLLSRRQAFLSAVVLMSVPLFVIVGRVSLTDETLSMFLAISLLSFAIAAIKDKPKILLLAYFALSLAVLCKGPVAVVLVGLIVLSYFLVENFSKIFYSIWRVHPIAGLVCILVITAPYFIWAHTSTNGAFTSSFFFRQNIGRMVGVLNHVRPFWWYLPIVLAGFFPWSFLLVFEGSFVKKIWSGRSTVISKRRRLLVFASCWMTITFLLFSAIPTKLETYIIPLAPAFALFTGCYLDVLVRARRVLPIALMAAVVLLSLVAGPIAVYKLLDTTGIFLPIELAGLVFVCLLISLGFHFVRCGKAEKSICTISGATLALCAIFIPLVFAIYYHAYQMPIDRLVQYAKDRQANLAVVYFSMPSVIFHYGRQIPLIRNGEEMLDFAEASDGKQWILLNEDVLSLLHWTDRSPRVVVHDGRFWLFAVGRKCKKENTVEWNGPRKGVYPTLSNK